MKANRPLAAVLLSLAICGVVAAHPGHGLLAQRDGGKKLPNFEYDPANVTADAKVLEGELNYDADVIVAEDGGLLLSWLEYTPEEGDRIWVGRFHDGEWLARKQVVESAGEYARPTLTRDGAGTLWLSYEAASEKDDTGWDVYVARLGKDLQAGEARRVSDGPGADTRHRVAADPDGGLWFVWQSDQGGQFDVAARRVAADDLGDVERLSEQPSGDWHPAVAVTGRGVHVVWDGHDGHSYNVWLRVRDRESGRWSEPRAIAGTPALEARAQIAADGEGRVWIAWEEGAENWGTLYLPRLSRRFLQYEDDHGPLHRYRRLRMTCIDAKGNQLHVPDVPMPSVDAALERSTERGVKPMGAFYERGRLAVDGKGRVWLAYRHYYAPWIGGERRSHVFEAWGVYARCLTAEGWSPLARFDENQGDGLQRLEIAPAEEGIAAVWTSGRTDRRSSDMPRGIVVGRTDATGAAPGELPPGKPTLGPAAAVAQDDAQGDPPAAEVAGEKYELFFGDLHRHTDLSLCRVPLDGTIDDAYRYAIDVAGLDFFAVTDHSRDIDRGDALSLLWWRSRKEVFRHELGDVFFPFFGYERSHGNTADHNVISLKGTMLRPHTYPVPVFWKELDEDTMTIPHQPIRRDTWKYQDDVLRPLVEIYQGCRTNAIEKDVHEGLAKGYHLGIIASSDHMTTSSSYAGVWSPERSREGIFRAMQARRTFGATAPIRLLVRAGEHWMGEEFSAATLPPITVEAEGTAPIQRIVFIVDGEVHDAVANSSGKLDVKLDHKLDLKGKHYVYVRVEQADGNRAWSSPLWVEVP